jgi:hypothetical protein
VALAAGSGLALVLMLVLANPVNNLTRHYAKLHGVTGAAAGTTRPTLTAAVAGGD